MEEGVLASALREFKSCHDNELSLSVGTVVQVHHTVDRYWTHGSSMDGHTGTFPTDYVMEIALPVFDPGEQLFVARINFSGQEAGDLSFRKGDIIVSEGEVDTNWHRGRCNGQFGIFPLNLVWPVNMDLISRKMTSKVVPGNRKAKVKMDLKAQLDEEIDLQEGDIVTIVEVVDKDWYRGTCKGKTGIFPSAFVTLVDEDTTESLPDLVPFVVTNGQQFTKKNHTEQPSDQQTFGSDTNGDAKSQSPVLHTLEPLPSVDIRPYARTLYQFRGEIPNELSFVAGETVNLIRHVDTHWLEGELRGKVGLFPKCYVHIILDTCTGVQLRSKHKEESLVLHDFQAQLDGDVTVSKGDTVTVLSKPDNGWCKVKTSFGQVGLCPASYLGQPVEEDRPGPDTLHRQMSLPTWSNSQEDLCQDLQYSVGLGRAFPMSPVDEGRDTVLERSNGAMSVTPSHGTTSGRYDNWDIMGIAQQDDVLHHVQLRRLSCPSSPQKSRTAPARPPLPVHVTGGKSTRTASLDRVQKTPHRPAPPVPLNARRPHSVATATSLHLSLSRRNHPMPRSVMDTDKRSSTSSESDTWIVCSAADIDADSVSQQTETADVGGSELCADDRRVRNQIKRQHVLAELVQTEKDYIRDLQFCHDAFLADPSEGKSKGVDVCFLFGCMEQILALSKRFLRLLEHALSAESESKEQNVGTCFKQVAGEMKDAYSNYCTKHDDVLAQLEKYEENPEISKFFRDKLERGSTHYFDMSSVLIKPVQRITKYPLIINELVKTTEDCDSSKKDLLEAIELMTDVASAINECKRKKDLVMKYRKDENQMAKLGRLNLHSVVKKSQRIGMRLSSTLGLVSLTKDMTFDDEEQKFRAVERATKAFAKDCETFCTNLQDGITYQFRLAEDVADFYGDCRNQRDVDEFRTVQRTISNTIWPDFKTAVDSRTMQPLATLSHTFDGPNRLIEKRHDKLLDYDSASQRIEKNKDINRSSILREELQLAKNTYEALNSQLLEELPKLTAMATLILQDCVSSFVYARKRLVGRITRLTLSLTELLQLTSSCSGDVLDNFEVKHVEAIEALAHITLVPKEFQHSPRAERSSASRTGTMERPRSAHKTMETQGTTEQSSSQKAYLQGLYPPETLHCVVHKYTPADFLEIPAKVGDIVSVIKRQDPMGRTERWFVDDGAHKGFVPAKFLAPVLQPPPYMPSVTPELHQCETEHAYYDTVPLECTDTTTQAFRDHRYDIVFEDNDCPSSNGGPYRYENLDPDELALEEVAPLQSHLMGEKEYHFATYEFRATGPNELSMAHNQVVLVRHRHDLDGNCDWWFVEDRYGNQGYVPANYLARYQHD